MTWPCVDLTGGQPPPVRESRSTRLPYSHDVWHRSAWQVPESGPKRPIVGNRKEEKHVAER